VNWQKGGADPTIGSEESAKNRKPKWISEKLGIGVKVIENKYGQLLNVNVDRSVKAINIDAKRSPMPFNAV